MTASRPLVGVKRLAWVDAAQGLLKVRLGKLAQKAEKLEGRAERIKDVLRASPSRHARAVVGFDQAAGSLEKAAWKAGLARELVHLSPADSVVSLDRMTAARQQLAEVQAHASEAEMALQELAASSPETPWALQEVLALQQETRGAPMGNGPYGSDGRAPRGDGRGRRLPLGDGARVRRSRPRPDRHGPRSHQALRADELVGSHDQHPLRPGAICRAGSRASKAAGTSSWPEPSSLEASCPVPGS